jgi:hypothetical protein
MALNLAEQTLPCEKSSHFGSVSFEDSIQNFKIKGCFELDL